MVPEYLHVINQKPSRKVPSICFQSAEPCPSQVSVTAFCFAEQPQKLDSVPFLAYQVDLALTRKNQRHICQIQSYVQNYGKMSTGITFILCTMRIYLKCSPLLCHFRILTRLPAESTSKHPRLKEARYEVIILSNYDPILKYSPPRDVIGEGIGGGQISI